MVSKPQPVNLGATPETSFVRDAENEDDDEPLDLKIVSMRPVAHRRPFPTYDSFYRWDASGSISGLFTGAVTSQSHTSYESADDAPGVLLSVRRATDRRVEFQFNYQYSHFTENLMPLNGQNAISVPLNFQEFTGLAVMRSRRNLAHHYRALPFLGVGGGIVRFLPTSTYATQVTPALVLDSGVEIPTNNAHISFRLGGHLLFYRAPTLSVPNMAGPGWVATSQPAAGVQLHF